MKSILAIAMLMLLSQTFAQGIIDGTATLKGGSGSYTGTNGQSNVLFTSSDRSGTFTIQNSGANPYRATVGSTGHVWGVASGTFTTTCTGYSMGTVGSLIFQKSNGQVIDSVTATTSTPVSFSIPFDGDYPASGLSYEVIVKNSFVWGTATSCTTSASNVVVTVFQPIAL